MTDRIEFHRNGPHSDDYTIEVAAAVVEAVRVLNYATGPHVEQGLTCPQTVYTVTAELCAATGRLEQLLRQLTTALRQQAAAGRLADESGEHPDWVVARAAGDLELARSAAITLNSALRDAQNAASSLYVPDTDEQGE